MVNPGSFTGSRRVFLEGEVEGYGNAVQAGNGPEFLTDLVRRFFKRYPMSLDPNTEPSAEHLASVNDDEADPDIDSEACEAPLTSSRTLATHYRDAMDIEIAEEECLRAIHLVEAISTGSGLTPPESLKVGYMMSTVEVDGM